MWRNRAASINAQWLGKGGLEMVLFVSHICHIVQFSETSLRCVCEHLPRVGDGFATYAMTWRRFCDDFYRTKKYDMFKTFTNRSDNNISFIQRYLILVNCAIKTAEAEDAADELYNISVAATRENLSKEFRRESNTNLAV